MMLNPDTSGRTVDSVAKNEISSQLLKTSRTLMQTYRPDGAPPPRGRPASISFVVQVVCPLGGERDVGDKPVRFHSQA